MRAGTPSFKSLASRGPSIHALGIEREYCSCPRIPLRWLISTILHADSRAAQLGDNLGCLVMAVVCDAGLAAEVRPMAGGAPVGDETELSRPLHEPWIGTQGSGGRQE